MQEVWTNKGRLCTFFGMAHDIGSGSTIDMDSSFESNSNGSPFGFSDVSGADINLTSPCDATDEEVSQGNSTNETLVENDGKQVCGELTENLRDTDLSSESLVVAAGRRVEISLWLNSIFPALNLSTEPSEEDLRECLRNGVVLCNIVNRLRRGPEAKIVRVSDTIIPESSSQQFENIKNFCQAVDELRLPTFEASDLEHGSMVNVVECLLSLKEHYEWKYGADSHCQWKQEGQLWTSDEISYLGQTLSSGTALSSNLKSGNQPRKRWILPDVESCNASDSQIEQEATRKYGQRVVKLPGTLVRCSMNNGLDTKLDAQSLLSIPLLPDSTSTWMREIGQTFQKILQEKIMRHEVENTGALSKPDLVEFMLRKVMEEYEHRIQTQVEHMKKLKHALREVLAREDKLLSRAKMLEALAAGTGEEIKLVTAQLKRIKVEKRQLEDEKKVKEQDMIKLARDREESQSAIKVLKEELKMIKRIDKEHLEQLEIEKMRLQSELQGKLMNMEVLLANSKRKTEELEMESVLKMQNLRQKDMEYRKFLCFQVEEFKELKKVSEVAKEEVAKVHKDWQTEIETMKKQLMGLANAAAGYHKVLAENRQLYNEVQDLKGNIRVYCRVRPFLAGQDGKQSTIDYIGENGDLLIIDPNKQGKNSHKMFKFNKVFGPSASQERVFMDTRPLIRSVLDGYNVCIFAYGQTGSGKTFTMSGPVSSSQDDWGVNYRALNDLFQISQKRKDIYKYEIAVQMIEIYNEQVHDLLTSDASHKRLGIRHISQFNGPSVPDASTLPVESMFDVLDLMKMGQKNRAVGATALNERSSRSHSILTVHIQGTDLASGTILHGCLHLVDLAGSERVDRSEATGDRLKEAQHINKSLSALGDVISALANKTAHVPYRNSKLTQILQDSLGGQAKTLMFVHLNPDIESYLETISTLKFAERVSGVEMGAAKSNKESKDIRDLKEQVSLLKDVVARKDAEIKHIQTVSKSIIPADNIYSKHEKLKSKAASFPANPSKSPGDQQIDRNQIETLTGAAAIESAGSLVEEGISQVSEAGSVLASPRRHGIPMRELDDISGKNSMPKMMRQGLPSVKRLSDSKLAHGTLRAGRSKAKLPTTSLLTKTSSSKEWKCSVHSSSDLSVFGASSEDDATTLHGAKIEKMEAVSMGDSSRIVSDTENGSQYSDKHSYLGLCDPPLELLQSKDHCRNFNKDDNSVRVSSSSPDSELAILPDIELLGLRDGDLDERLSEISDGDLSMGTETDGSISSIIELTLFPKKRDSGKLFREVDKRPQCKTLIQPHARPVKNLGNVKGTQSFSARRLNGVSTTSIDAVKASEKPASKRQSANNRVAGSFKSSKQ